MRIGCRVALIVLAACLFPAIASAQGAITGVVRDTSGAILPGVTVEASSPALIEKARSAVTDSSGQYRIEDLRPGSYVVTFTLAGFSTVRREGIELTGSLAALVNVELRVGALEETITVKGESPIVDVVNAKQQSVLDNEVIAAIPTARLYHSLVTLVPGVSLSGSQDVGGLAGPLTVTFAMRGGPGNEGRLTVDGLSLGASLNGTGVSYTVADVGNAQEVVFSTAGGLGEAENAGPAMNLVPRQGGNRISGNVFANWANGSMQSSNFTDEIRQAGLRAPNALSRIWDTSLSVGGPIRRDRLWFFAATRYQGNHRLVGGMFRNRNAGDVNAWTYVPEESHQAEADSSWKNVSTRLTWQASPRNKFNFYWDEQRNCTLCNDGGTATTSPEARDNNQSPPRVQQATWTSPATSRLLYEAGFGTNLIIELRTEAEPRQQQRDDSGHRAVHGRVSEQRRDREPELPRQQLVHRRQQRVQLARRRDVCHRPSQRQGRLSRAVHRQQVSQSAQERRLVELPRQQRRAEPVDDDGRSGGSAHACLDRVVLRAGSVDEQTTDGLRCTALRPRVEPLPAAAARAESVLPDGRCLRPLRRRVVQRHHATLRRRLRRVWQRQDGGQGERRQVSRRGRWQLDHRRAAQSAVARLDAGEPHVDGYEQELRARLRSAQPAGAGSQCVGRRLLRPQQQPQLRPAGLQHHLRPGHA